MSTQIGPSCSPPAPPSVDESVSPFDDSGAAPPPPSIPARSAPRAAAAAPRDTSVVEIINGSDVTYVHDDGSAYADQAEGERNFKAMMAAPSGVSSGGTSDVPVPATGQSFTIGEANAARAAAAPPPQVAKK